MEQNVNVNIFSLFCSFKLVLISSYYESKLDLGLDIQDDLGRHEVGHVEDTVKIPINEDESGCQMKVKFKINRVPGNFHVSTHASKAQPGKTDMRLVLSDYLCFFNFYTNKIIFI